MRRKRTRNQSRILTPEEDATLFSPLALEKLHASVDTMGPFEADPSSLSPEQDAKLDALVDGYCTSGHDPSYWSRNATDAR